MTVSRLASSERYKGHDRVIRVLPRILLDHPDTIYLVVGDGDDRPRLEALTLECGVQDKVMFTGPVVADELPDYYRLADVMVMPSTGEGFGIVFLEAMASGIPRDRWKPGRQSRSPELTALSELRSIPTMTRHSRRQYPPHCAGQFATRMLLPGLRSSLSATTFRRWSVRASFLPIEMQRMDHHENLSDRYFGHDHVTIIEPQKGWRLLDWRELWAYRELLFVLTMRDIKVRYKQTVLGFAWAIIQPVMMMVVFSIFFGGLAQNAVRWLSLSNLRLRSPAAMDVFCQCHHQFRKFACRIGQPREQGLFPAAHHPALFGRQWARRFRDRCGRPCFFSWSITGSAGRPIS